MGGVEGRRRRTRGPQSRGRVAVTTVRILTNADRPIDLYRFRYSVYVEEMRRPQRYANHDEKIIVDPLDETGYNVVAFDRGLIAGCVRINFLRDGPIGDYAAFYEIEDLDADRARRASICTRLMIRASNRRTAATLRIMMGVYDFALRRGIDTNYIDCNRHLVGFFKKFGYVDFGTKTHVEYGPVTNMRLDLRDRDRLARVASPFLPAFDAVASEQSSKTAVECECA